MTFYVITTKQRTMVHVSSELDLLAMARLAGWNILRWVRVR
jgi:hypothetical protein